MKRTVFVSGLFWDRNASFFERLCRHFEVIASHYTPFAPGERFPYTVTEELIGYDVMPPVRDVAWEVGRLSRFVERTAAGILDRPVELTDAEHATLFDAGLGAMRAGAKLRALAARVRVDMVVTSADYDLRRRPLVLEARELGIPTLGIEHGFFAGKPRLEALQPAYRFHMAHVAEFVNLDNRIEVETARRDHELMHPDRPAPAFLAHGTPQDAVFDPALSREAARATLGLDGDAFVVLLLGSSQEGRTPVDLFRAEIDAVESYRRIFHALGGRPVGERLRLVIKMHPAYRREGLFEEAERCLARLAAEAGCPRPVLLLENLAEALAAADVLVTPKFTSVLWDGFLARRPSIVFPTPRYREWLVAPDALERANVFFERGITRIAFDGAELCRHLDACREPGSRQRLERAIDGVTAEYGIATLSPEDKSERICAWIAEHLEASAPRAAAAGARRASE